MKARYYFACGKNEKRWDRYDLTNLDHKKGDALVDIFHQNCLQNTDYVQSLHTCLRLVFLNLCVILSEYWDLIHLSQQWTWGKWRRHVKPEPKDRQVSSMSGKRACLTTVSVLWALSSSLVKCRIMTRMTMFPLRHNLQGCSTVGCRECARIKQCRGRMESVPSFLSHHWQIPLVTPGWGTRKRKHTH